ncbi:MAG: hypothetical protein AAB466_00650 [Verrucomicrobiota bacterium]
MREALDEIDPNEDGLWIIPAFTPESATPATGTPPAATTFATGPSTTAPTGSSLPTGTTPTPGISVTGGTKLVQGITINGSVPLENWAELFRCFINPAARMNPKKLQLGVDFELVFGDDQKVKADDRR